MPAKASLEIRAANEAAEVSRVAEALEAFGTSHGFPASVLHDVQVCVDEALTNIIEHAFDDGARHEVRIRIEMDERRVIIEIVDDGRAFDPLGVAPPVPAGAPERRALGGLGIYFMRRLMDHVAYERMRGTNRLVMSKNLRGSAAAG